MNDGASARPASRLRAAATPASAATCQCSIRISSSPPSCRQCQRAMSPAATMPSAAKRRSSQTTPLSMVEPGVGQPVRRRDHADAHHDDVRRQRLTAVELHHEPARTPADPAGVVGADAVRTPRTATPVRSSTPCDAVQRPAKCAPIIGPEDVAQRDVERLEHGDPAPEGGTGGGHLGPDETGADDDDPASPRPP